MDRRSRILSVVSLTGLAVVLVLIAAALLARSRALLGTSIQSYTPLSGPANWEGNWEFSEAGADPSQAGTERVTIPFVGTGFSLSVRRGDYRGYFFVWVDGKPANLLPVEARGAYLVLTSPDGASQVVTIPVAAGLADGAHVAEIVPERGWDQWPLVGWTVSRGPDTALYGRMLVGLVLLGLTCLGGLVWQVARHWRRELRASPRGTGRWGWPVSPSSPWPTLNSERATAGLVAAMLAAAALFYFSPWLPATLVGGVALALLIFLRLDLGLALAAAVAPFYLKPRALWGSAFSMVEIVTLLCALAWGVRWVMLWWSRRRTRGVRPPAAPAPRRFLAWNNGTGNAGGWLDVGILFFVSVAFLSFFAAEFRHVALRELRILIVEPALFYLMLRTVRLDRPGIWRIVDMFIAGAVAVAGIGLAQYALGVNLITAEEGFRRLRSVYGSPNSVGLYLGRVLPILVAYVLLGVSRGRRLAYGLALAPVGLAVFLCFSKGALLLGVPLSLLALGLLAGGRWLVAAVGLLAAGVLGAIPLLRTPRFASLLNTRSGTTFLRLSLWRSAWAMFRDHLWLGVGPDNFLYSYRSRYILPAAWQEPNLSQAHNILLDYATRMGLPGLAVGAWLQVAFWRLALPLRRLTDRDLRALALGLMASMVNFVAHGLVDASYFLVDLAFAFYLTLGIIQWLARSRTDELEV